MKKFNLKGVPMNVWVGIVAFLLSAANLFCTAVLDFQLLPFTDEEIYDKLSSLALIISGIVVGWKDTPLTVAAQKGHELTKELKKEEK